MKQTLASKTNLNGLNIVGGCKVQRINEDTMKWETIGETVYTPFAINEFLKLNKLQFAWVNFLGNREMWTRTSGRLAVK